MSEDNANTPLPNNANLNPDGSKVETPSPTPNVVTPQPQNLGNSGVETLVKDLATQVKVVLGRITKLEQGKKGKLEIAEKKPKFSFDYPDEEEDNQSSQQLAQERETLEFEKGVTRILRSKKYDTLLTQDKTLAYVIDNNPISLLSNPTDAEEAVLQIQNFLDKRLEEITAGKPDDNVVPKNEEIPAVPPVIPANSDTPSVGLDGNKKDDDRRSHIEKASDNISKDIISNPNFLKLHR